MVPDERGGDVWPERAVAIYCALLVLGLLVVGLLLTDGPGTTVEAAPTAAPTITSTPSSIPSP
jgi:hypothetical protein